MFAQDYLVGDRPLEHLQHVLMDLTWDNQEDVSADTLALARLIETRIAEFTGGYISEDALKGLIREAAKLNALVASVGDRTALARAPSWSSDSQTRKVALG